MNAMQKAAWTELAVVLAAAVGVACLLPWLGNAATGMFGLLGLLPTAMLWFQKRGDSVVTDERDQEINLKATFFGVHGAWMLTFLTLIFFVLWSSQYNDGVVPTWWLTWLIWIQFAACYGVQAIYTLIAYRGQSLAS